MDKRKVSKVLLIIAGVLLIIELPWFFFIQWKVNTTQTKSVATVVAIQSYTKPCTTVFGITQCDPVPTYAPTYKYSDSSGVVHTVSNRYLNEYKKTDFLYRFFAKKVGDKATVYYDKKNPDLSSVMDNPWVYTAWVIPILPAILFAILGGVFYILSKLFS